MDTHSYPTFDVFNVVNWENKCYDHINGEVFLSDEFYNFLKLSSYIRFNFLDDNNILDWRHRIIVMKELDVLDPKFVIFTDVNCLKKYCGIKFFYENFSDKQFENMVIYIMESKMDKG